MSNIGLYTYNEQTTANTIKLSPAHESQKFQLQPKCQIKKGTAALLTNFYVCFQTKLKMKFGKSDIMCMYIYSFGEIPALFFLFSHQMITMFAVLAGRGMYIFNWILSKTKTKQTQNAITTWLFAKQQRFGRSIFCWFWILCLFLHFLSSFCIFNTLKKKHTEKSTFFNCGMEKKLFAFRIAIMRLILSISSENFRYHHFALYSPQ